MRRNFLFISFITVLLFILIVSCTPPQNATVEYTITFDGNGSDGGSTITEKALDGATHNITSSASFNRKGYTLKGWNTERDGKGTAYSTSDKIKISNNITLYAQWEIITYTITYNLDGGRLEDGVTNPTSYTIESETFTLHNPIKDGHTFSGWRLDGNEDKITPPLK